MTDEEQKLREFNNNMRSFDDFRVSETFTIAELRSQKQWGDWSNQAGLMEAETDSSNYLGFSVFSPVLPGKASPPYGDANISLTFNSSR